jgi:hypothetical protein
MEKNRQAQPMLQAPEFPDRRQAPTTLAVVIALGVAAFVIWAPAAAFLALSGAYTSAIVLTIWGTLVVGLVDNVVYPILVGNKQDAYGALLHCCRRRTDLSRCAGRGALVAHSHPDIGANLARSGSSPDRCTATTA